MNKLVWSFGLCLALIAIAGWAAEPASETTEASDSGVITSYLGAIKDVPLAADEVGKLVEVMVDDGVSVPNGAMLAQIDDKDAIMARDVAEYKYKAARKQATNDVSVRAAIAAEGVAKASYDKILQANERQPGSYTETEVLRAKLDWERSGLQIDLAKHEMDVAKDEAYAAWAQLKQAEAMIERRKLKAPFAGVVNQVVREQGEWVNAGDAVVHLVQMDRLRVHGRIEADRFHWKDVVGKPVEVIVHLPGGNTHQVSGKIGFASPVVDDDGTFRVWAEIENTQVGDNWLLGPGLAATMQLR
jgi:multidrug resistance efflux pump